MGTKLGELRHGALHLLMPARQFGTTLDPALHGGWDWWLRGKVGVKSNNHARKSITLRITHGRWLLEE